MITDLKRPVLQPLKDPLFSEKQLDVRVLRLDLIHPHVSGNKHYKLKYTIEEFRGSGKEYLVTFGGAFSNHIVATAAAGKEFRMKTIGIIRGEELNEKSNARLRYAKECGMELKFVTREEYRKWRDYLKQNAGRRTLDASSVLFPASNLPLPPSGLFFLPEGGSNELAVKGCMEITKEIAVDFDVIGCAVGTGATLAGISASLKPGQSALGISVLKGATFLEKNILKMNGDKKNFKVIHDFHFGGYARKSQDLENFCSRFTETHQLEIEPVYTGRLFYAIHELIQADYFKPSSKIVLLHTGGILRERVSFPPVNAGRPA